MVDGQVEPTLSRHSALPIAAGVIVHQLLLVRHPEEPPHLHLCLSELPTVLLLLLTLLGTILLCNDALQKSDITHQRQSGGTKEAEKGRRPPQKTHQDLSFDEGGNVFFIVKDGDGLQQVGLQPIPVLRDLLP